MHPDDGRVVSNFIVQALKGKPITIYGDGKQTRSFCYVDDLIDAFILFMATDDSVTGPLNLGNPDELMIGQFADMVIELTNSKSKLLYVPLPSDDPRQRQPDLSRTKIALGWEPTTRLREGLLKTISYFDRILQDNLFEG
jgi:UDP-glucuronate decarboxylase